MALGLLCAAPAVPPVGERAPSGVVEPATPAVRHAGGQPSEAPEPARRDVPQHPVQPAPDPYPPVTARAVDLKVEAATTRDALDVVRSVEGVAHATEVRVARVPIGPDDGGESLVVASVDPAEYRLFAPQVTADAVDVWHRLDEGALAITHEHVERLGLVLGDRVRLGGAHGYDVRVGAVASNGTPPIAEAIVDRATGRQLGIEAVPATILVATDEDGDPDAVATRLADLVDAEITVVPDPRAVSGVTPAPPQGDTVWDVLAMCESSGDWHANTGNGFYGGLQFLPESWWLVGGSGMPHEASREEQILRGELLLERQGWVAWPVCSVRVGLREGPVEEY